MAEIPSLKQILDVYYALRAQGVQRFPRPLSVSAAPSERTSRCLFLIDFTPAQASSAQGDAELMVPPPILKRLLDRLPWRESVALHTVFSAQPKSPQLHPLEEQVVDSVRRALLESGVERCVCFGWRAAQVCAVGLGIPFAIPAEAYEPLGCEVEGVGRFEILVLPDVREIEAFPEWRARVWESLLAFGPAR